VAIAERGRGDESVSTAEVFSWSELPDLLAAEDLFEGMDGRFEGTGFASDDLFASGEVDDLDEDDDFEDEDEDEDEDDDEEDEDDRGVGGSRRRRRR